MRHMKAGAFARAWRVSDQVRCACRPHDLAQLPTRDRPVWCGRSLAGRTVLVRCHHGLGDTIQFIRYVTCLAPVTRAVHVKAQASLLPLLARFPGIDGMCGLEDDDPDHDAAVEVMEFPYVFRTTPATIPAAVPYLDVDSRQRSGACRALAHVDGFRVGLVWAAGTYWRPERSLPLAVAAGLGRVPGVSLVSLQRGPAAAEAVDFPGLFAWTARSDAIVETAAVVSQLDLVIGVDTMVIHLAGALAVPTWTLLSPDPDWRWMAAGSRSPWYPTMRLFRQLPPTDWTALVARVSTALCAAARAQRAAHELSRTRA